MERRRDSGFQEQHLFLEWSGWGFLVHRLRRYQFMAEATLAGFASNSEQLLAG